MSNRRIRGEGINGEQILDFEEIGPDDWRGVDLERSRGICVYMRQGVITRLADLIGAGHVYRLGGFKGPSGIYAFIDIDRAGNIWLEHEYLAPHQYLPRLIPESS